MGSDWVRIGWLEGVSLVLIKTGRDVDGMDECIVLRQFNDSKEALKYAAALMDGIKIVNGEAFTPTDWRQEVGATPEALLAMTRMIFDDMKNNERGDY